MDLIDKQNLVAWLKDVGDFLCGLENSKPDRKLVGKIIDHVEAMPTVDAVPVRHGKWIAQDTSRVKFMCSECNARNYGGHENYCPYCGAKME